MTKAQLIAAVAPCTVEFEGRNPIDGRYTVVVETPHGYRFDCGSHTEVTEGEPDQPAAAVHRFAAQRHNRDRVEKCPADCECTEEPE